MGKMKELTAQTGRQSGTLAAVGRAKANNLAYLTRRNWEASSHQSFGRLLENRIVFCADCDANQILTVSSSGSLICSSCGSENWMHLPIIVNLNFKESVFIQGDIKVTEDLTVEGRVEGKIELGNHHLLVGPTAKINATIQAGRVTVMGAVTGTLSASETVEIKATGSVIGTIRSPRISIADGAFFQGSIEMMSSLGIRKETNALPEVEKSYQHPASGLKTVKAHTK
jgi:cytoskeletal protein CcmA (bactofilin family)